jgi:exopolyphosphatase/guanosine-5'-triphosphate,3'-diphosphate pyrophosphatase
MESRSSDRVTWVQMTRTATAPISRIDVDSSDLRLAAIDVGSNSVHMVVAQADADGGLTTLWRLKEMVGLGRISFPSKRLSAEAMDRAIVTLARFSQEAQRRQCEKVLAVATSAIREAENGGLFIERIRRELGLHLRVVSARDEARLIYLGVRHAMDLGTSPSLIIDIGGGSVEFIVARRDQPLLLESRKLGSARMTARYIKSDPASEAEIKALLGHYEAELRPLVEAIRALKPVRFIGTSGTLENLAAICSKPSSNGDGELVLEAGPLSKVLGQLAEMTSEDRARIKGLDDKRRDQILAGALLVDELFQRLNIERMQICGSALREGILVDYLSHHRPQLQVRREVPEPRRRAILDLARRSHWHQAHAEQVGRLTLRLFDQLQGLHGLGRKARELIEYGALLHDIGFLIGPARHHKHAMYLILNGDLAPFMESEARMIACIARYHRKAAPSKSHPVYAALSKDDRRVVKVGAALLRIADGLDRTNCAVVTDVRCRVLEKEVRLTIASRGDSELEVWSALARGKLFEEVFERGLSITTRPTAGK